MNEIIDGEIPQIFRQEDVNLEGITPQDGIYRMLGTHQQENNTYIKSQNNIYQVEWDQTTNTWRVFDSANTNRSRITVPIKEIPMGNGSSIQRLVLRAEGFLMR
ncbi:hypothetical protein LGL94_15535 [Yersinia ruckeri]|uniref:hypothetical protein n=1 Tax=Yersinia ruckeri TaxID=29486 RepID=UPI001F1C8F97|nr:hypothetical protein [Yersinia ruckeri]UIN10417.1 hypothetical protein LGL94_15535 [Yersinia ruckeri]